MSFLDFFENEGNGDENEATFFSLSGEFLEAAIVLHNTPPTRISYSIVIYYLLGHSAELLLKSFLYKNDFNVNELKKAGHNLNELSDMAVSKGLTIATIQIRQLSELYREKRLEYRNQKKRSFPDVDLLIDEVKSLKSFVFCEVSQFYTNA